MTNRTMNTGKRRKNRRTTNWQVRLAPSIQREHDHEAADDDEQIDRV